MYSRMYTLFVVFLGGELRTLLFHMFFGVWGAISTFVYGMYSMYSFNLIEYNNL